MPGFMAPRRIAILSDSAGWHERRLQRALAKRGVSSTLLSLHDCSIGHGPPRHGGLWLPGFAEALPDAVLVRAIPGGSFEQVTFRLDILHALRECGVPVYNDGRAIERTVDKAMTSFLLLRAGVATPPVWVCESTDAAKAIIARESATGRKLVLKPLFGARGQGLQLIAECSALPEPAAYNGMYYLQSFIANAGPGGRDWRVLVIGGKAVAAMERHSRHWITNRARGGECRPTDLTPALAALAEAATCAVRASYAGVDIIRDQNGEFQVLEVNGIPAWRGLQSVCELDIAQTLADDLLRYVHIRRLEVAS
ncbi:MAG: RimK family alpha-L-glutamate ligase [Gammaproteobacteria bacterium]